jgi:hypothetical protein
LSEQIDRELPGFVFSQRHASRRFYDRRKSDEDFDPWQRVAFRRRLADDPAQAETPPEEENEMWRRLLSIWVITIALCSGLRAQGNRPASDKPDPRFQAFYGIWETNNDETKNYIQKSQVFVITPQPGGFTEVSTQVRKDNSNNCEIHVAIFDGKPHESWGGDPREFIWKLVDSHTYERMWWAKGKRTIHRAQVSPDSKEAHHNSG